MNRHSRRVAGTDSRMRHRSRRLGPGRVIAILVATIVCVIAFAIDKSSPARAGAQRPALTLVSQSSYVSGAEGSSFQMSVRVSSAILDTMTEDAALVITSHRPVSTRDEVRSAIADDLPQIIDAVRFPLVELLEPSTSGVEPGRIDLFVRTEIGTRTDEALQMSATGVYPLTIDVEMSGDRVVRLISFIERLEPDELAPSSSDPVDLALVGRLDAPVSLAFDGTTEVSSTSRELIANWTTVLERRPNTPLTVAVQPELLDAFEQSFADDKELLIGLQRTSPLVAMSTTYVEMDPTDADRHGLSAIFTRQLRLGESTLSSLFPTRVAPRHSWVQTHPLSSGGARILADLGFRTVVITPHARAVEVDPISDPQGGPRDDIFEGLDPTRMVELAFSDDGMIRGSIVDADLAAALENGSDRPVGGERLVAHQVLADLKMQRLEMERSEVDSTRRALILSTTSGELPSSTMAEALMDVLSRDPRFEFTRLDDALTTMIGATGAGDAVERIELSDLLDSPPSTPASASLVSVMQNLDSTVDAFASVLPRDDDRVRSWRRILDVLPDGRLDGEARASYVETVRRETREIAASVVPPASTTFTLGGRDSPIRFSIRNDGPTDLEVLVRLRSSKLRLSEGDKVVTVPARTSTSVEFAVSARSNGRFPVTLQLFTPRGEEPLGSPSTLTARVNALAGLGQLVTGIALLFLLSWWANHFRREYRRRQSETYSSTQRHPSGDRLV